MNRRAIVKSSALAIFGLAIPSAGIDYSKNIKTDFATDSKILEHYPNLSPELINQVVGKSHSDLDTVKQLVDKRPELSRSVWEWRFGDFESAIGAASHVGRRDIALYLMNNGARPTLFTFAMLGHYQVVKSVIEGSPGIQTTMGPHGISLLDHAYAGQRMKGEMTKPEVDNLEKTIDYLTRLGNAGGENYVEVSPGEQQKYLGDYMYGSGDTEGFTIALNMRKLLSLAPVGGFGGALYKIADNKFIYNGAPSVEISFDVKEENVLSMRISDPDVTIEAEKVT